MKDIFYKGYRLYIKPKNEIDIVFKAVVLGREEAKYHGKGKTEEEAIINLKKDIDKVRD